MQTSQNEYGIARYIPANNGNTGWRVSIIRNRVKHVKFYSDKRHGGKVAAFIKAKEYRDHILKTFPAISKREKNMISKRNNRSGIPGVYYYCTNIGLVSTDDRLTYAWKGYYTLDGKRYIKSYSINKYGYDLAKQMAIDFRRAGEALMTESYIPGISRKRN